VLSHAQHVLGQVSIVNFSPQKEQWLFRVNMKTPLSVVSVLH